MSNIIMKNVHASGASEAQIYIKDWPGQIKMDGVAAIGGKRAIEIFNSGVQSEFGSIPTDLLEDFWASLRERAKQSNGDVTPETVETAAKKSGLDKYLSEKNIQMASFVTAVGQLLAQVLSGS